MYLILKIAAAVGLVAALSGCEAQCNMYRGGCGIAARIPAYLIGFPGYGYQQQRHVNYGPRYVQPQPRYHAPPPIYAQPVYQQPHYPMPQPVFGPIYNTRPPVYYRTGRRHY